MNNSDQQITLIDASYNGQLDVVNQLLDCKEIDINLQNKDGDTVLIWASWGGQLDVVNRLLDCKEIDINLQNKDGKTALILASKCGHLKVVELLKKIHRNQIREGFKMANKDGSIYVYDDIIDLIFEFTY